MIKWMQAVAVVGVLAGCSQGPSYRGEELRVLDMHLHTGEWSQIPPHMQKFLASRFPPPLGLFPEPLVNWVLSTDGILGQLDDAGIERAVLFAVYAPETVGTATNELVAERIAATDGRLLALASIPSDDWKTQREARLAQLEQALAQPGFVGIKLAHPHMRLALDGKFTDDVFALAARLDKAVYVHTGNTPAPGARTDAHATDPAFLESLLGRHPSVRVILGHVGYDFIEHQPRWLDTILVLARDHANTWLEPSALGSAGSDPDGDNYPAVLRRIREAGLAGRLVYGSDGPQSPGFVKGYLERTLKAADAADYTVDEVKAFLYDNVQVALALEPPR